jgi:hypothetical protein
MLTFNNDKWDFWAVNIAELNSMATSQITADTQSLLDRRAVVIIAALRILLENAGQPLPVEKFETLAISDIAALMMIYNHHFSSSLMTFNQEGLQIAKEALMVFA